jgi:chromosome segregation ATPase
MGGALIGALAVMVAAGVAALATYVVAARRASGKIATTEASALWSAAEGMRSELRTALKDANERTVNLERRVADMEGANNALVRENLALQTRNIDLGGTIAQMRRELDALKAENLELRALVEQMQKQLQAEGLDVPDAPPKTKEGQ